MARSGEIDYGAVVTAAWSEVLGRPHLRPTDNFFFLGGDSLSAVDVVTSVARQLGVTDEGDFVAIFMALFDHAELAEFAAFLRTEQWAVSSGDEQKSTLLPTSGEAAASLPPAPDRRS